MKTLTPFEADFENSRLIAPRDTLRHPCPYQESHELETGEVFFSGYISERVCRFCWFKGWKI